MTILEVRFFRSQTPFGNKQCSFNPLVPKLRLGTRLFAKLRFDFHQPARNRVSLAMVFPNRVWEQEAACYFTIGSNTKLTF